MKKLKAAALADDLEAQRVVCFTETPLHQLYMLFAPIEDRSFQFQPYGLALTKMLARRRGINPVWYVDITPGHDWLMQHVDSLVQTAIDEGAFADAPIARLAPFIEQMGTGANYRKEFWWEREWRHLEDFFLRDNLILIAPKHDHARIEEVAAESGLKARSIDASWGLEEIIAMLAGFAEEDVRIPAAP